MPKLRGVLLASVSFAGALGAQERAPLQDPGAAHVDNLHQVSPIEYAELQRSPPR